MPLRHWSNSSGDDLERQFRDVRRRWIPAGAGTPGFENETWSLEVFGCGWCHPSPLDSGLRRNDDWGAGLTKGCREWRMSAAAGAVYFHSNRSCRLRPAHQGMKNRICGLVQRIGTADSATPHPDPSGGQAPALHFLIPPSAIGPGVGRFPRGAPASRLIGGHIFVPMTIWGAILREPPIFVLMTGDKPSP